MEIRSRHWLAAAALALLLHGSLLMALTRPSQPEPVAVIPYEIALGGLPGPAAEPASAAPLAAPAPIPAATPALTPLTPVAQPELVPVHELEPEPPKPKPKPVKPAPKPQPKPQARPQPPRTEQPVHRAAGGTGSGQGSAKGSSQGSGGGGGGSGTVRSGNYYGKLAHWLDRHKRYPRQARRLRQQGRVEISFTIDRQGRLVAHRIVSSSGHPLLDAEVKAMLQRANPMPRPPAEIARDRLTIQVPIDFALR
ncbi:energy transducer TonB [Marichromatium gracile]|uniref:Protein TonB n=1 Tax=Marichromatium gracile TaxID=1048 RepID=A0ABR5VIQ2_MARGR|nr:energy transducer TonB [Marichromatium gracile]KXX65561.1 hypothetical protein AY586_09425 [Marichromatium gracile]